MIKYYNIPIYEAYNKVITEEFTFDKNKVKIIIEKNKFKLFSNKVLVSETGYNIEDPDKYFNEKYVTLYDLKTFDKYQGKGFAKYLLEQTLNYVKNNLKINIVSLIVYKDNYKASKLYFNMGFEIFIEYADSYCLIKKLT